MPTQIAPEDQERRMLLVRLLIGDTPSSPFYPIFTDEEVEAMLELYGWDVRRASRQLAISAAFQLSMVTYRERTGDIEVWNNASLQYQKALGDFIDAGSANNLPDHLVPYAAGISKEDYCAYLMDPDVRRSPLVQISPCVDWWTNLKYRPCCGTDRLQFQIR